MKLLVKQTPEKGIEKKSTRSIRIEAPLHPIFVHFTIGLTASSLVFDALGCWLVRSSLSSAGFWALIGAALITLVTLLSGAVSASKAPVEEGRARSFLRTHMVLGFTFFGSLMAVAAWRLSFAQSDSVVSIAYLCALAAVALLMAVQGYLGGELVYRFGVGVQNTFRKLPVETENTVPPQVASTNKSDEV